MFDVILRRSASTTPTTELLVRSTPDDADGILTAWFRAGIPAEDWTS